MNKRIKSLVMLVPFAAGLISGDAVFASSSLEKSKMFIGRGKKNLADAVDKNDVNCDEELSLSGNKTENKIKDISDKNTQASRFGPLEILGINSAAVGIGTAGFGIKKLVKILQKHRHRGMEKDEENLKEQRKENSKPHSNPKSDSGQVNSTTVKEKPHKNSNLPSNPKPDSGQVNSTTIKEKPHKNSNLPSNPKPDSGQVNSTTIKEKPYGDISLWIKENPKVFSLVVILFTAFLIFNVFFHVRTRRAIKKLNEKNKELNEEIKKSNKEIKNLKEEVKKSDEEIKELNKRLELNEIGKKLNEEIDKEIGYISKFVNNMNLLKDFKNYKAILKQIISSNTDKTLTLILYNNKFDSDYIRAHMNVFYALAGRFYDTLGGFWYVVPDEEKIKENLKKDGCVKSLMLYPENATKINIKFFSIDNYLTRVRTNFDKVKTKNFYNDDFEIEEKMFLGYYNQYFTSNFKALCRDYAKELESELELNDDFFNKYKDCYNGDRVKLLNFIRKQASPDSFYIFLTNGCLCQTYDDRSRVSPEIRIKFIKYAIEKLINDEGGKYNLSNDNKIFLKYRFNALLLFGELMRACYKKNGDIEERCGLPKNTFYKFINDKNFHYGFLDWCKANIKSESSVRGDGVSQNEKILFLARMEVEYLIEIADKKDYDVEKTFGEILDIYKGNPVTIYNYNNKFIDHLKYAEYLKDANINFKEIQFME